ncbi:hypothetical protein C817_00479 [Dorea sp. 5-2]|nr:hypothetical protein C817_00479 [Dorea sp. 5-2]
MKIQENRRFLALFCMLGFLIGIIYANLMSKDHIASMGIFNEFFLNQYSQEEINMPEYLWYIVRIRVMPAILVAALGCTKLRRGVVAGFLIWTGFCGGMIMTAAVLKMGIKGLILCLIALAPHLVFYIAGYLILLWYLFTYPDSQWNLSKMVSTALFLAVGVLLECYVNPIIMELFLKTL